MLSNFEIIESLKLIYFLGATAVLWPLFYVEAIDYLSSLLGNNGKLYKEYSESIKKDLIVSLLSSLVLASIYWRDSIAYDYKGIDLGFIGIPFLIIAMYTIFQMSSLKIAGKPVKKKPIAITFLVIFLYFTASYSALLDISSGEYSRYKAIWFQLTILFASIYAFTSTSLQIHSLSKGKFGLSKFKKHFFRNVIYSKEKLYESLEEPLERMNKNIIREKAIHSSKLRKKK